MKILVKSLVFVLLLFVGNWATAQTQNDVSAGATVAKNLGMYIYPASGQSAEQTTADENECYNWAIQQSGYNPLNPTTVTAQQVQTGPTGQTVAGSAGGAAVGAAIGAIAGDAGKGAAIGAVSGAVLGLRARRQTEQKAQSQANQQAAQTNQSLVDGFKKAYSACLQGKGYTVN
ncbi:MAG TPA: YMGG-like glycine zipper-containing protein [Bacteroidales bacterium]